MTEPVTRYYFAYGSNMNQARMRERSMSFDEVKPALLEGYSLVFNKRSAHQPGAAAANLVETPGRCVEGVLYRLADQFEILKLDPFEGHPVSYRRATQRLRLRDGGDQIAWVYHAQPAFLAQGLRPARWYLEHLLAGREFLSVPYYERLARTECLEDL